MKLIDLTIVELIDEMVECKMALDKYIPEGDYRTAQLSGLDQVKRELEKRFTSLENYPTP